MSLVPIIPVEIDSLPVPVRAVKEAQRHYLELEQMAKNILMPVIEKLANEINNAEDGTPLPPELFRATRDLRETKKLQLEYLRIVKELTVDQQSQFEQHAADTLVNLIKTVPAIKNDPAVKEALVNSARDYLRQREKE